MQIPTLFDAIDMYLLNNWRKEIEKNESCNIMGDPQITKETLAAELNGDQKKLLNDFELAMINRYDNIYYFLCNRLFNFAFNGGMEFQKALDAD